MAFEAHLFRPLAAWSAKEPSMYALPMQKQAEVADLRRSAGARRLDVFGSTVRADFDPMHSDLDFLVEFDDVLPAAYAQAFFNLTGLKALVRPGNLWVVFGRFEVNHQIFPADQIGHPPWTSHLPTGQACGQPLRGA